MSERMAVELDAKGLDIARSIADDTGYGVSKPTTWLL